MGVELHKNTTQSKLETSILIPKIVLYVQGKEIQWLQDSTILQMLMKITTWLLSTTPDLLTKRVHSYQSSCLVPSLYTIDQTYQNEYYIIGNRMHHVYQAYNLHYSNTIENDVLLNDIEEKIII